jgi:hypothetical protein
MKYREVLQEEAVLAFLDGSRDEATGKLKTIYKYTPSVRLDIVRRLRKVKKHKGDFEAARIAIAEQHEMLNKQPTDVPKEQWEAFVKDYNALLDKECFLHPKKWKAVDLNLKENQIPVEVLDEVLEEEVEQKEPQELAE